MTVSFAGVSLSSFPRRSLSFLCLLLFLLARTWRRISPLLSPEVYLLGGTDWNGCPMEQVPWPILPTPESLGVVVSCPQTSISVQSALKAPLWPLTACCAPSPPRPEAKFGRQEPITTVIWNLGTEKARQE